MYDQETGPAGQRQHDAAPVTRRRSPWLWVAVAAVAIVVVLALFAFMSVGAPQPVPTNGPSGTATP